MTPSLFKQAAAAALATLCTAGAAPAAPVWITIGDQAHAVLQKVAPKARTLASARVAVTVPVQRGGSELKQAHEGVFAVEVNADMIPSLSLAVHRQRRKCGGFVQHGSPAEALATLHRLENADEAPLLLPSYAIDNPTEVGALLPQLQASNLLSTITDLSAFQNRRYNSTHGVAASDWLRTKWLTLLPSRTQTGSRPRWRLKQITHTWAQKSVEFELIGTGNSGETLVLGAHLDSIAGSSIEARAPGADDDASGVAGLTEIIRVLVANNFQPRRNIRFIAYAAEEVGLLGSAAIATAAAARPDRVVGVMQLDMTAFKGSVQDLWIYTDYTNAAQNQFLAQLAAAYLPNLTVAYDACGYGCSDHASWHNRAYVASFPFEAADNAFNFALHTADDTTATFGNQADHALKFTQLALAWLVELASDGTPAARREGAGATPAQARPGVAR